MLNFILLFILSVLPQYMQYSTVNCRVESFDSKKGTLVCKQGDAAFTFYPYEKRSSYGKLEANTQVFVKYIRDDGSNYWIEVGKAVTITPKKGRP